MFEVIKSETYSRWISKLKDQQAVARINARIRRLSGSGHFGDVKPVREGVSEMRIDYGPGYRVYYQQKDSRLIILLAGGDKSSQVRDIEEALMLSRQIKEDG